jgi:hypothetical protein
VYVIFQDKTSGVNKRDDGVPPQGKHTYVWQVKEEHGPTASDSDCLTWAYHSHVNPKKDVNTGLVGNNQDLLQKISCLFSGLTSD